jgi:hypothetical protein
MELPNYPITPIPDTAPSATPSLWNTRYTEIDENFDAIDDTIALIEPALSQLQTNAFFHMFAF